MANSEKKVMQWERLIFFKRAISFPATVFVRVKELGKL